MQKKLLLIFSLLIGILCSGIATTSLAEDTSAAKVQKLIEAADAARKQAASVGGEWRDTGKMIKKAKTLMKKGDLVKAAKLANKAAKQGHLGYEQAMSQATLKMPSYLHYE
ncbi:MAG: SoxXA-binding protein [Candidatus Thiodiazotropha sp.]|nr:SoxXA-binding protein [Candidatus Thiodiazotropha sp.]MCU7804630.1 SoxXA-binding protein [Candidatus Thiodiazotropha sp. (ex Lucinoma borealis)]MCU7841629.1 SoxXA-binding protein [Candidatus Thiodiazotropha sp. (ex Troendleina suluensis)]MCU7883256.1 SoxXA-binding protein [Candidatus Thiodiazotropha sp. (ex Lucinoma annulata)]MCU7945952.1 SoxXA-binding protein [Candidatus Thiodiazotropha sp. (ex Cardiolucina cf. quadrata)]